METLGPSRIGRLSSRYGGSSAVFSGPVRKWKKKWVLVPPPPSSAVGSQSNNHSSDGSSIRLCRWTPLSTADEEPPRRKFRYAPTSVLEEEREKSGSKQLEDEAKIKQNKQPTDWLLSKNEKVGDLNPETQDSDVDHLDLELSLEGHNAFKRDSMNQNFEQKAAKSSGFWM